MNTCAPGVPDLLRRFVPTPYELESVFRGVRLAIQTNDSELISAMQRRAETPETEPVTHSLLSVKVVRDREAPVDGSTVALLTAGPLTTLTVGVGTLLTLDIQRHEILGFLASSVSSERFIEDLLSTLVDLSRSRSLSEDPPRADVSL
jgi:hypothetical protein